MLLMMFTVNKLKHMTIHEPYESRKTIFKHLSRKNILNIFDKIFFVVSNEISSVLVTRMI